MKEEITKRLKGYYYYFNWKAGQKNKIHKYDCPICRNGAGMRRDAHQGLNGVWVGPFKTTKLAQDQAKKWFNKNKDVNLHSCCNKD